ncbi:MAG: diacylglycerol kinase family protein [Gemmatimonadales bacterium]|jgi:diacylglycerol kinase family enzyme
MIVILNPTAGAGTAGAKWRKIEPQVQDILGAFTLIAESNVATVEAKIAAAIRHGERDFIAAGGDGTINLVMTSILRWAPRRVLENIRLGAIGLGSSNDFHKPLTPDHRIEGVPIKLDFDSTIRHDVCLLTYRDADDCVRSRPWLINASVGTTAEANRFFNDPSRTLRRLKRIPTLAIAYAALRTIFRFRGHDMTVTLDEQETVRGRINNLGIVKNPHFTGVLAYDSPYVPGDGYVHVHLLRNLGVVRLLVGLARLARGKFGGRLNARSWRVARLRIESERPFAVEGDGEVIVARRAHFSVLPGLLQVCT